MLPLRLDRMVEDIAAPSPPLRHAGAADSVKVRVAQGMNTRRHLRFHGLYESHDLGVRKVDPLDIGLGAQGGGIGEIPHHRLRRVAISRHGADMTDKVSNRHPEALARLTAKSAHVRQPTSARGFIPSYGDVPEAGVPQEQPLRRQVIGRDKKRRRNIPFPMQQANHLEAQGPLAVQSLGGPRAGAEQSRKAGLAAVIGHDMADHRNGIRLRQPSLATDKSGK